MSRAFLTDEECVAITKVADPEHVEAILDWASTVRAEQAMLELAVAGRIDLGVRNGEVVAKINAAGEEYVEVHMLKGGQ